MMEVISMQKTSSYHIQCTLLKNELELFHSSTPHPKTFHINEIRDDVDLLIKKIDNYFADVLNKKEEPLKDLEIDV